MKKPIHVRKIDESIPLDHPHYKELLEREEHNGYLYVKRRIETEFQPFFDDGYTQISFDIVRKDDRTIEYYLTVEHPNEEGSWV